MRGSGLDVKACHGFIFLYVKHVQLCDRDIYLRITHINMIGDRLFSGAGIQSSRYFNLSLSLNSGSDSCSNPLVLYMRERKWKKESGREVNCSLRSEGSLKTVFLYPMLVLIITHESFKITLFNCSHLVLKLHDWCIVCFIALFLGMIESYCFAIILSLDLDEWYTLKENVFFFFLAVIWSCPQI